MRCNEKETLSLGALLSQANDHPPTPKPQYNVIDSLCGSTGSLKSIESSSYSKNLPPPPSPTDSVSESNVIASSDPDLTTTTTTTATTTPTTLLQSLKFDIDLDVEVQSPVDNSIWDSFLADQLDPSTDFMVISSPRRDYVMISSPKRDYMMISSPKRDYMISSPKRDNMISSPKREYMVITSPKRTNMSMTTSINSYNYGYAHGVQQAYGNPNPNTTTTATSSSYSAKGKSPSPLHKVLSNSRAYNSSSSGGYETLLDGYGMYSNLKDESTTEVYEAAEEAVGGMTATLLECLGMPSLNARYGESSEGDHQVYVNGIGIGSSVDGGGGGGGLMGLNEGSLGSCKSEIGEHGNTINASYHGLLGPITTCDQTEQEQDNGLHLVHLLLACAESVAKDDYVSARRFLHHLDRTVSPLGDSMQRVASCFADALSARLLSPHPPPSHPALPSPSLDTLKFYQILYQACPYVKFAHFTANQAIFEAFEAEARVHVIDLDILQGYQWPAFLQALAVRPGGPPSLRITGVGYPAQVVRETGRHLAELAHSLGVPFEFHPAVADRLEDLRPHMLHRRVGEALAVNSVNRLHRVPGPHLGNLLAMIRDQAPNIVTLVEQEASHNGSHFLGRFLEALHYYSAIFDSLDATFPPDSAARAKVEQYIFQPEIRNIVACEGPARFERHERLEKWRKIMEGKGFKGVDLSPNAVGQSKILLGLYSCDGYRLTEDKGCLLLGWQDRPIIAASAWRC